MIDKTYNDFKKWLCEKNKKSPFYIKAYNYILDRYNSKNTESFYIEEIEKEILKDYDQVENTDYIDEKSLIRNIRICIKQVIDDLCSEQKIIILGIKDGRKCYQINNKQIEMNSNVEEVQK